MITTNFFLVKLMENNSHISCQHQQNNKKHHWNHLKQHIVLMMVFHSCFTHSFNRTISLYCMPYMLCVSGLVQFFFVGVPHAVVAVQCSPSLFSSSDTHYTHRTFRPRPVMIPYIMLFCCNMLLCDGCVIGEVIDVPLL